MKIDLTKYVNNKKTVELYLKSNTKLSFQDKITNISMFTNMPLIVSAYYVAKIEGESPDFKKAIENISKFYKYDEVLHVKEFMEC